MAHTGGPEDPPIPANDATVPLQQYNLIIGKSYLPPPIFSFEKATP